mmetsp:Transcript_11864/g.28173  ORF Transcript_11864/g.28173 Transcript_11864/m.28173 type:complete len:123 (+) Transcript_11864:361-729(+)
MSSRAMQAAPTSSDPAAFSHSHLSLLRRGFEDNTSATPPHVSAKAAVAEKPQSPPPSSPPCAFVPSRALTPRLTKPVPSLNPFSTHPNLLNCRKCFVAATVAKRRRFCSIRGTARALPPLKL